MAAGINEHCCYPVLESGSTAVTRDRLDGGYKSVALELVAFERREDTISIGAPCTASTSAVTLCVTGFVVLVR